MEVLFVGVSSCLPDPGGDTASFLINGKHLVDTGWCSVQRLRDFGLDPLDVESVILTHLHQDHYLGLPHLLFHHAMSRQAGERRPLRLLGPAGNLGKVVASAMAFLQTDRFPELRLDLEVVGLKPGEGFRAGGLQLDTCAAKHVSGTGVPEEALSWRATEVETGAAIAFTGDTSYNPEFISLAADAGVIVHDAAHSTGREAAEIARAARAGRLYLIHCNRAEAASALAEARFLFPETYLAEAGERIAV